MALAGLTDIFGISRTVILARIPQEHALGLDPSVDTGFAIRIRANH
jgi:hypothetical protein